MEAHFTSQVSHCTFFSKTPLEAIFFYFRNHYEDRQERHPDEIWREQKVKTFLQRTFKSESKSFFFRSLQGFFLIGLDSENMVIRMMRSTWLHQSYQPTVSGARTLKKGD